jgi:hypothetical protein
MKMGVIAVALALVLGCDTSDPMLNLAGTYELVVGTNQTVSRKDLAKSTLVLSANGTFVQDCQFSDGKSEAMKGEWRPLRGNIHFSKFKDCAGAWPGGLEGGGGASLVLESRLWSSPVILLSPDVNVYYHRTETRRAN